MQLHFLPLSDLMHSMALAIPIILQAPTHPMAITIIVHTTSSRKVVVVTRRQRAFNRYLLSTNRSHRIHNHGHHNSSINPNPLLQEVAITPCMPLLQMFWVWVLLQVQVLALRCRGLLDQVVDRQCLQIVVSMRRRSPRAIQVTQ